MVLGVEVTFSEPADGLSSDGGLVAALRGLRPNGDPSGHVDDDLAVVEIHRIGPQRCGTGGGASGIQLESVHMERTEHDSVVGLPVCDGSTLVRADRGQGTQAAVPLPEHRNLVAADGEGATLAVGDLVACLPDTPDEHALHMAMSRLRRALDVPGLITTIMKRGYRFNAERMA